MNRHLKTTEVTLTASFVNALLFEIETRDALGHTSTHITNSTAIALCNLSSAHLASRIPHRGVVS